MGAVVATRSKSSSRTRSTAKSRKTTRRPSAFSALRQALGSHLGRQSDDVWGLALLTAGVLAALGIYVDVLGPAGQALRAGSGLVLGVGRFLVPVFLAGTGLAFLRDRVRNEPGRVAIGLGLLTLAVVGFAHLGRTPALTGPSPELRAAGGYLGAVTAGPMRAFVGPWGAAIVFAAIAVMGLLALLKLSARAAAHVAGGYTSDAVHAVAERLHRSSSSSSSPTTIDGLRHRSAALPSSDASAERIIDIDTGEIIDTVELEAGPTPGPSHSLEVATAAEVVEMDPGVDDTPTESTPEAEIAITPTSETGADEPEQTEQTEQLAIGLGPATEPTNWKKPALTLLKRSQAQTVDRRAIEAAGRTLEAALAAHGVETRLVGMTVGPAITRYELELGPGVKVARVTSLNKDIAYAMASADVRILAPIPGRSAIGIEVPNRNRALVTLGDILSSEEAHKATHPLEVALGRDIAGRAVLVNLASMPHVLIAGATGAGKSSCINSLITSVLVRNTPEQVRMILIDPKRVELGQYNGLPHLLTQVVTNPKKAANALQWAVTEMERRYDLLAEVGVRDITGYNAMYDRGELQPEPIPQPPSGPVSDLGEIGARGPIYQRLPFVLVVVDELNDLMMVAARDVEASITRIAQMARAVGIHLVIATQRPSVDVITGVIKANIPSRMAFAVSSLADSRVILDQPGAERLIGQGDMLLLSASSSVARRIQGGWVGEDEVRRVAAHWKRQGGAHYVDGVEGSESSAGSAGIGVGGADSDDDEVLEQAMELVVRSQLGSTSMLQRKLRVGFARAGRLMDLLEQRGVVGPSEGSKARAVLMTVEELEERLALD